MSKPACPKCHQNGKVSFCQELHRYPDAEGFVAAKYVCHSCGFSGDMRVLVQSPPCENCGFSKQTLLKQNAAIPTAPTNAEEVLRALRGAENSGWNG